MKMKFIRFMFPFITLFAFINIATAVEFPEKRSKEADLFPKPQDNYIAQINPPGFSWLGVEGTMNYRFTIKDVESDQVVIDVQGIRDNIYVPRETLNPGNYEWTVSAFDEAGRFIAERKPYKLTIPEGLIEQPLPDIEALIEQIPGQHSRLIFLKENLPEIRKSLSTSRKTMWEVLKNTADACLDMKAPIKPTYEKYDIKTEYVLRRMEYQSYYRDLRPAIDKGLQALSLTYLLTEDKKYATAAKRILLEIATWDPHGITSSNHGGFDEVGLSLARCTHRAYDWLYEALTEEERDLVRNNCIERARDTYMRVAINRPFHRRPGSSHDGRLIGYLGEQAIVLVGEAPDEEVKNWITYSIEAFMTVYPHWGGDDGGWAEGLDYGPRYNMFITPWIEGLQAVSDIDLWQRPFFRNVRHFFTSCTRPNAEHKPFADGAEINLIESNRHTTGLMTYLLLHSVRHNDPAVQWWAEQLPTPEIFEYYPVIPLVPEIKKQAAAPPIHEKANYFKDVGWVAMHSDFADLDKDVFMLFKSSPYASISHSHADQNAFHISVGGRALCIASGYYGPVYGMPHHALWTRATKANNCILVNGEGQNIRDFTATGQIDGFKHTGLMTYTVGDATVAYKGLMKKCLRHVLFIRPGLFVMLDDLEAPEASTFQWLLHTLEPMTLNENKQHVLSTRKGAWLDVKLYNSTDRPLKFSQSDEFDTKYLQDVPEIYLDQITDYWHEAYQKDIEPHYHFQASSVTPSPDLRIAAFMTAGDGNQKPEVEWLSEDGWTGVIVSYPDGKAEVWVQLDKDASHPKIHALSKYQVEESASIIGIWHSKDGKNNALFSNSPGQ